MKILCLLDSLGSGGAQRQLVNLAVLWKKCGYDVIFACYRKDIFYLHILEENNIQVCWVANKNYFDRFIQMRRFVRTQNADFVVSFLDVPNFLGCVASIGSHNWRLITNELSAMESSFTGIRSRVFKWFERYSDATVCNSKNAENMWKHFYPEYKDKLSVIYNPVMIPEVVTRRAATHQYTDGVRRIVIAASYQYLKNPVGLVEAVHLLDDEHRKKLKIDWYGRIEPVPGDSRAYDEASMLIEKYNLSAVITLHSATTDIYEKMGSADAVGLFSTVEGLPNAICEGMTLGKPILMSRVSDYDVLVGPDNGFLCDAENYQSIADALTAFTELTGDQLCSFGDVSREKALKLFSPESILDQWDMVFRKA